MFKKFKDPKNLDSACKNFPSQEYISESMLQMYYRKDCFFHSFCWLTNAGVCYGTYATEPIDKLIKNFVIVPFVKLKREGQIEVEEGCLSIAHSEYHYYLLFNDCISVISKINNNIVHTEFLYDAIIKMKYDRERNCLWLHSTKNLYQMVIENESRDVWKAFLEKEDYEQALIHCESKNLKTHSKRVNKLYAAHLYDRGEYVESAHKYGKSDEKFEEVALKFLVKNQYEALKVYLLLIEKNLPDKSCITQRNLLATWLTEIYLHELNNTTDSKIYKNLKDNFKAFMMERLNCLDKDTIYQLFHHYGRTQEFLEFAEMKSDYETVILYYVNEKNFQKAIEKLHGFIKISQKQIVTKDRNEKQELEENLYKIFSKYSHVFMKYQPEMTIELLLKNFKQTFDPNKIISAIMNTEESKREKVCDYLEDLINCNFKDKNVHNLYIFFLSQLKGEQSKDKLLNYLQTAAEQKKYLFEVDYALKVFSQFKIYSAQAWALAIMGKYDEAVKIALENNYPKIAKSIANTVNEDNKLKKLLWLEVFKHQMQDENVKKNEENNQSNFNYALSLMEESNVLKIEDVLPNIMGNIKIEVFKSEITKCINNYENSIESLKNKIYSYNETAKNVKSDIFSVKKKFMRLKFQQCICYICNNNIKEDNIFIFPCGHYFDSECLLNQIKLNSHFLPNLQEKVEKLLIKRSEITNLEKRKQDNKMLNYDDKDDKGTFFNFMGFGGANEKDVKKQSIVKKISISNEELVDLEKFRKEYIDLLCEECVLCGDMMIESIKEPFLSSNSKESWMLI